MILLQPHSPTPGVSGGRSPSLPPLEKKETDGDQLDHPYIKNCQIYNYLTKVELLFYFWSLQREQNMGWGAGGGPFAAKEAQPRVPPPCPARATLGRTWHCRCHSARPGCPRFVPTTGRGQTLSLASPPCPGDGITVTVPTGPCSHASSHQTPWAFQDVPCKDRSPGTL